MVDKCSFDSCERQVSAYGLCSGHQQQHMSGKELTPLKKVKRKPDCDYQDCTREHYGLGYCQYHARQFREGKELTPAPEWKSAASWKIPAGKRVDPKTGNRWCTVCKRWLPLESFVMNKGTPDGVHYNCGKCSGLARYGLTSVEYDDILEKQGGVCKICRGVNESGRALSVDHDHSCCPGSFTCGKCVRHLLCHKCNSAIGYLRDDPDLCERAANYLRESKLTT